MQSTAKQKCRHTFVHTSMHALSKKRGRKEAEAPVASRMSHVACRMSSHVCSPETTKNSSSLPLFLSAPSLVYRPLLPCVLGPLRRAMHAEARRFPPRLLLAAGTGQSGCRVERCSREMETRQEGLFMLIG